MLSHAHLPIATLVLMLQVGAGNEPSSVDSPYLAQWRQCMADSGPLYDAGRLDEATRVLEKSLEYARHFATSDPRLPTTLNALGFLYHQQGKYDAAVSEYRQAIPLWEQMGPKQHDALRKTTDNLIGTYLQKGDYASARKLMESRLPEMERATANWEDRATFLNMRAALAATQHRRGEAERLFRESLSLWQEHSRSTNSAIVLMSISRVLVAMKRYQEGLDAISEADVILERMDATDRPLLILALDFTGSVYMKLGRPSDAGAAYRRALGLSQATFGPEHVQACSIMLRYSAALRALGQHDEANVMASKAKTILAHSKEMLTVDAQELSGGR